MERYMKPERLGIDPNTNDADKTYKHWFRTFNKFLESLSTRIVIYKQYRKQ